MNNGPEIPQTLYSAAAVRELDRFAIEEQGIPGIELMQRAGAAAFNALLKRWPNTPLITVYAGTGNNAGDGFIIAMLAQQQAIPVQVVDVGSVEKISGDALRARELADAVGVAFLPFADHQSPTEGVIVDALLGTGLGGDVREPFADAIAVINGSALPVLAADIPSGLCSDTGNEKGIAVSADITVTFIGVKRGLLTGRGPVFAGDILFDDLAVPAVVYEQLEQQTSAPPVARIVLSDYHRQLAARPRDAHKGMFGHVLVIGGDRGMAGAAAMAAEAAARSGAGLVSVATQPEHLAAVNARCPELMVHAVPSGQELKAVLERPSVIVIGPGLGQSPWSEHLAKAALASGKPAVVDADALNLLAAGRLGELPANDQLIITPHPGEAARLLLSSAGDVQRDRFESVSALQQRYGGVALLKGNGTLVAGEGETGLCDYGNPGMASGGMGDVLSGVIGGLLAQGVTAFEAATLGACLHGAAADIAAEDGERGLAASDLVAPMRALLG